MKKKSFGVWIKQLVSSTRYVIVEAANKDEAKARAIEEYCGLTYCDFDAESNPAVIDIKEMKYPRQTGDDHE